MSAPDLAGRLREALTGRYTIGRELGRGGMATVFLAHDLRHDRPVALKVLHPELAAGLGAERFEREIRVAARLQHPHILPVHDSGDAPGDPPLLWFTMPFVDGESLRDRLRREPQLPLTDALRIVRQVADALDHAHRQGVVHRDIKPENILLTGEHALVADFGVARALTQDTGGTGPLTATGLVVGTMTYMSPEQATGEPVDGRCDQYALATTLYEMLAGEPPFGGPTAQVVLMRRLTEEARPLRATRPGVPEPVEAALRAAMARAPADRFATLRDFVAALDAAPSAAPAAARRPGMLVAGGVGVLVLVAGLLAWSPWRGSGAGDEPMLIAVLPFENQGDTADAWFTDGMSDEVRGKLSAVPGFQVIARASATQYRGTTRPLREVADELGVRYLLTATVHRVRSEEGDRVRVRPELVEVVRSGATVTRWQEAFDALFTDVFQVQAGIASQVVVALRGALAPETAPAVARAPTDNMAAWEAFLRGEQAYLGRSGQVVVREAMDHYERAVALDPGFARAHARLAQARSSLYVNWLPTAEVAELARQAGERAVELAPDLAEAHLALGGYRTLVRGDYAGAIEAYQRGLALAPAHPELLGALGLAEQAVGRMEDAIRHMREGLVLDPRSLLFTRRLTRALTWARRHAEAAEWSRKALVLAPTDPSAIQYEALLRLTQGDLEGARRVVHDAAARSDEAALIAHLSLDWSGPWWLDAGHRALAARLAPSLYGDRGLWALVMAGVHEADGDLVRARAYADTALWYWEEMARENPEEPATHVQLAWTLAVLGRKAEAMRAAEHAVALRPNDMFVGPMLRHQLVRAALLVGEHARALEVTEELLRDPYYFTPEWLRIDPTFDPVREHPRFRALIGR